MPCLSNDFVDILIEPTWRLLINILPFYLSKILSGRDLDFSEEEKKTIEAENHNYFRGYESDEEEEIYGIEGFINELIRFLINCLKKEEVKLKLKNSLSIFLLITKNFCILESNKISLWKSDPYNFIIEEYIECSEQSIRFNSLRLIKSMYKILDDDVKIRFLKLLYMDFHNKIEIYNDLILIEESKNLLDCLEFFNQNEEFIFRKFEANLLILGDLKPYIKYLKILNKLESSIILDIIMYISKIKDQRCNIFKGRVIWSLGKIFQFIELNFTDLTHKLIYFSDMFVNNTNNDLTINFIISRTIKEFSDLLLNFVKEMNLIEPTYILQNLLFNVNLLTIANEDTIFIPIDSIISLSKLYQFDASQLTVNSLKIILEIFIKNINIPIISQRLIDLIEILSKDSTIEIIILEILFPNLVIISDDYINKISNKNFIKQYLEIRNHLNINFNKSEIKLSFENLPVNII